jgi:hypothetical protein
VKGLNELKADVESSDDEEEEPAQYQIIEKERSNIQLGRKRKTDLLSLCGIDDKVRADLISFELLQFELKLFHTFLSSETTANFVGINCMHFVVATNPIFILTNCKGFGGNVR